MEDNLPVGEPSGQEVTGQTQVQFEGPEWLSGMPDDLRNAKSLHKFKDIENVARGYVNAESMLGRDKIPMPKTDEEFADAYAKLGCPADANDYQYSLDDVPNEHLKGAFEADLKGFRDVAKNMGLNQKQMAGLFDYYKGNVMEAHRQQSAQVEYEVADAEAKLKSEFGQAYNAKIAIADRALSYYGSEGLIDTIKASGLGRNPDFIKFMAQIGAEHAEEIGIDKSGQSVATAKDLQSQINKAQQDPAYLDGTHPQHRMAVERVELLFRQLTNNR